MNDLDDFLAQLASVQTRRAYDHDLRQFFRFAGSSASAAEDLVMPDPGDLQAFVDEMQSEGLSVATQRRRISAVRRFYRWLHARGTIPHNPVGDTSISFRVPEGSSSQASKSPDFLSREEIQSVLAAMDRGTERGRRDYALVLLILFAALRRSEVAALDVGNVRPLSRHWVVDLPTKGRGPGGYVPIPNDVADAVQTLVDSYDSAQGPLWRSLSPQNRGDRLSPDALYKSVRRAGRTADMEPLTIERLRQSGLRLASKGGVTVDEIRRHARLQSPASAVRYCTEAESSRLSGQVGTRIDLDL